MKIIAFLFLLVAISPAYAKEKSVCYHIDGMTCSTCSLTIKVAVKKLDGILSIIVDAKKNMANVLFEDQKISALQIAQTITDSGYKATEKTCDN